MGPVSLDSGPGFAAAFLLATSLVGGVLIGIGLMRQSHDTVTLGWMLVLASLVLGAVIFLLSSVILIGGIA